MDNVDADQFGKVEGDGNTESGTVAAECGECLGRFKLIEWHDGLRCPECAKGRLNPLVAEGGAVDYCVADRRQGYAPADLRFAHWIKWAGLITQKECDRAFSLQFSRIKKGQSPPPIHRIMEECGFITEEQALKVLEFMCRERPDEDDRQFADIVLKSQRAGEEKTKKMLQLQKKYSRKANETPALCQLMVERDVITKVQAEILLKKLQERGQGPLASLQEHLKGISVIKRAGSELRRGIDRDKQLLKKSAIAAILLLTAAFVWFRQGHAGAESFVAYCISCDETSELEWPSGSDFPLQCPDCRQGDIYPGRVCDEGHVFAQKDRFNPQPCPVCDSPRSRTLGQGDIE